MKQRSRNRDDVPLLLLSVGLLAAAAALPVALLASPESVDAEGPVLALTGPHGATLHLEPGQAELLGLDFRHAHLTLWDAGAAGADASRITSHRRARGSAGGQLLCLPRG